MASPPHSSYRPDIDGLRAVAVIAVILNHIDEGLLRSGYLGVDIFFVISGFVITGSLAARPVSRIGPWLADFYARRIRRIAPALLVCVLLTTLAAQLLIAPVHSEFDRNLGTGIGAIFGVSNLVLLSQSANYFADAVQLNAFTHTWSLGVEEQFYLVFPLLVLASGLSQGRRRGAQWLLAIIGVLSLLSCLAFFRLYGSDQPAAYFLMPTRFWEMAAGCLAWLAAQRFTPSRGAASGATVTRLAGLAQLLALGLLVWGLQADLAVPPGALLAVAATALLLLSGSTGSGPVVALLSLPPLRFLGLISYSLYLWHWSVLALARWSIGVRPATTPLLLLLIAGLSLLSWACVERPLRQRRWSGQASGTILRGLGLSALVAAVLLLAGSPPLRGALYLGRTPATLAIQDNVTLRGFRTGKDDLRREPENRETGQRLFLLGDSHAVMLKPVLASLAADSPRRVSVFTRDGCPFPPSGTDHEQPGCFRWGEKTKRFVLRKLRPGDLVVISLYSRSHLGGGFDSRDGQIEEGRTVGDPAEKRRLYRQSLDSFTRKVAKRQGTVVLVAPFPRFEQAPAQVKLCEPEWFRRPPDDCRQVASIPLAQERHDDAEILTMMRELAELQPNLVVFDPDAALCPQGTCPYFSADGRPLYRDKDHISVLGAQPIKASMASFLRQRGLLSDAAGPGLAGPL